MESRTPASLRRVQDRLAAYVGVGGEQRTQTLEQALHRGASESVAYWLQLVIAMGIATLGLVQGSTAVVIGAMLVSPLMGPIVELGLGLASGSPYLVLRSGWRTLASVALVVLGAALVALLIPFQDVNAEIRARTAPNALDLLIAVLCALAAVYTTTRPSRSDASTAAGTAIGISLVPPLCVSGYGLGISSSEVAVGAALLFTANFSAIVLVSTFSFLLLGYNNVRIADLEREILDKPGAAGAIKTLTRALSGPFASRFGPVLRLAMPVLVLAGVYVPLERALSEVSWQVLVRSQVQEIMSTLSSRVVESTLVVEHHSVALRLVVVGDPEDAERIREQVADRIRVVAGVEPTVDSIVLPDVDALRAVQASVRLVDTAPTTTRAPLAQELGSARTRWPAAGGTLLELTYHSHGGGIVARALHTGDELGPVGRELFARSLSDALSTPITVEERAVPATTVTAAPERETEWLVSLSELLGAVDGVGGVYVCVTEPVRPAPVPDPTDAGVALDAGPPPPPPPPLAPPEILTGLHAALDGRSEVTLAAGDALTYRVGTTPCVEPAAATAAPATAAPATAAPTSATPTTAPSTPPTPTPHGRSEGPG